MLSIEGLTVRFEGTTAVDAVDLEVPTGRVLAVLGPSGCGKSTLLRAVAGLVEPDGGRVLAEGVDLARTPTHRRGFALMFQDGQLFDHLDVAANVAYGVRPRDPGRVADLLDLVGLPGHGDRRPATLSGGERQRVALARALAVRPRLLLLDEPLSSLDAALRERLAADLRRILVETGTTALLVTHDHEEAFAIADDLAVMRAGRVVQTGPIAEVWGAPVDAQTALFLGYAGVVEGTARGRLATLAEVPASGHALALRRSALRVAADGAIHGRVVSVRSTPEQVRLSVHVDDIGTLDAVGDLGTPVAVGQRVRLVVDASRVAPVG